MPWRTPELEHHYSEILFRINDEVKSEEALAEETGLSPDDFNDHIATLLEGGFIKKFAHTSNRTHYVVNWHKIKESYAKWLDKTVDERVFFVEQIDDAGIEEFYRPLMAWDKELRDRVIHSEGLESIFKNGFRNFSFLLGFYHVEPLTINQFFNQFTISFSDYDKFLALAEDSEELEYLSAICDRVLVNPFGFFAFHTEYFPADGHFRVPEGQAA